jgi:ABC-type branched-subunit amino acid transport system ATPase component
MALLEANGLRVSYGPVIAVEALDLEVPEGAVVGLIGPNGAGKTSAIDALSGYHPASAGSVRLDGEEITRMRPYKRARRGLGRTFQSVELFDDLRASARASPGRWGCAGSRTSPAGCRPSSRPGSASWSGWRGRWPSGRGW